MNYVRKCSGWPAEFFWSYFLQEKKANTLLFLSLFPLFFWNEMLASLIQIQERDRCVKEIILILEFGGKVLAVVQARDLCEHCLQRVLTLYCCVCYQGDQHIFWTSHGPKESLNHLMLRSPWTRQAHFEWEVLLIFYYESSVGVSDIGLIFSC